MRKQKVIEGIRFSSLSKNYGKSKIFENLSASFPQNKVSLLIGKNGSGKSTLLKMLAGAEVYPQGEILINGLDLQKQRQEILDSMFFVSENFMFTLPYSVERMNEVFGIFYSKWSDEIYQQQLQNFGVDPQKHFSQLSRGQRMQLLCSIALAIQPKVLLLDEMTSVLDAHARHLLLAELDRISHKGSTVVLATNMVVEARELENPSVFVLKDARLSPLSAATLKGFVKIRITKQVKLPANFWRIPAQKNSDGSLSYLSNLNEIKKLNPKIYEIDKRQNTVEDFFIYHSALEGEKNEKAA